MNRVRKRAKKPVGLQHVDNIGSSLPKFGFTKGLKIGTTGTPHLKCAKPLHKTLVPIRGSAKSRAKCTSGLLTRPMTIKQYGAFRCAGVSTCICSNLTKRNCQDLGNQIAYDPQWRAAVIAEGSDPRAYSKVSPLFIEWLAGVPLGWTSLKPLALSQELPKDRRYRCFDWFSGVGGLNLSIRSKFNTVGFCEKDPFCKKVLEARMMDNYLDKAPVWPDVREIKVSEIPAHDLSTMGFPCQDISIAGRHAGFADGERSRLFLDVMEKLSVTKPKWILIENVAALRNKGMEDVWKTVLRTFSSAGYNTTWATLKAEHANIPMARERFFALARRRDVDEPFPTIVMVASPQKRPRKTQWLLAEPSEEDFHRLHALGNIVLPAQAQCAIALISEVCG